MGDAKYDGKGMARELSFLARKKLNKYEIIKKKCYNGLEIKKRGNR